MYRALLLVGVAAAVATDAAPAADQPNIVWLTCEDMSANLGCWGDAYATTPHIDRLASQSVRYTRAFATNPICSPTRSCLITGVYATSLGTQNLRSRFPIPESITGFPAYL
ncbi:MAG: sulfatase-like hydrolase/transferase, partial [Thermoguttaceae bacterium]|nr:sulfatase-like hydrolase/transferase [Thermoguttaceae bacterium]